MSLKDTFPGPEFQPVEFLTNLIKFSQKKPHKTLPPGPFDKNFFIIEYYSTVCYSNTLLIKIFNSSPFSHTFRYKKNIFSKLFQMNSNTTSNDPNTSKLIIYIILDCFL